MKEKQFFWNSAYDWKIENRKLRIGKYEFIGFPALLFPDCYLFFSFGGSIREYKTWHPEIRRELLARFLDDLERYHILLAGIQDIDSLFGVSERIYAANYSSRMETDNLHSDEVSIEDNFPVKEEIVHLYHTENFAKKIYHRNTCREFDTENQIEFDDFGSFMETLCLYEEEKRFKSFYPSAGALYPLNFYIQIKNKRIKNVKGGLYRYDALRHGLRCLSNNAEFPIDVHYSGNHKVYQKSAFSLYITYDNDIAFSKYRARGYFYGIIEAGIVCGILSETAIRYGLGSCIIGNMDFDKIRQFFQLKENEQFVLNMEFGIPRKI